MARIRTVKPEFWTDSVVVQLPYEARLLFIGIWNFCDDQGYLVNEPDRLRMQVFPSEPSLDLASLLDLLVASERLEMFTAADGESLLRVKNFEKHQRVDNASKPRFAGAKKMAIPNQVRRAVAAKYGCEPGCEKEAACFYCGALGNIHWWNTSSGKPSSWVSFSLELDHVEAEAAGGDGEAKNIVLACRACNRSKGSKEFAEMWPSLAKPRESSPAEGKGSRKGKEGNGIVTTLSTPSTDGELVFEEWKRVHGKPQSQFTDDRKRKVKARLKDYSVDRLIAAVRGCALDPFSMGKNDRATMFNDLALICRDGEHVEKFEALAPSAQPAEPEFRRKKDEELMAEVHEEFEAKHGRA